MYPALLYYCRHLTVERILDNIHPHKYLLDKKEHTTFIGCSIFLFMMFGVWCFFTLNIRIILFYIILALSFAFIFELFTKILCYVKVKRETKIGFRITKAVCTSAEYFSSCGSEIDECGYLYVFDNTMRYFDNGSSYQSFQVGAECYVVCIKNRVKRVYLVEDWDFDDELKAILK